MKKPSFLVRAREALRVFRQGYPGGKGIKSLPWPWPGWRQGVPAWHLIDLTTYVDEGFTTNSLVYSAVMYKVRAMATAPLRAYTGNPDYPERLNPSHSLARLVSRPNEHQSWIEFHSLNVVYLNISGNSYVYKDREERKLWPLRPDRVWIVPSKGKKATISHFLYVPEGRGQMEGVPILPEDMIHIKLPYPLDPLEGMGYGLSPLSSAAQSVDVDNMVTKFLKLFFDQGAMLTGILSFDIPLKEDIVDKILERWKKKYGGYDKWGVGVLDRGGKYTRIGLTFDEMGFGELDERNECRILGPFGVPPILIGSRVGLARSTYSNYEGARKAVWQDTLVPELKWFEVEYQYHLGKGKNFVQFDLSQVPALQKDLPEIVRAAYTLWQLGVPSNQALTAVGLRIGEVPSGDLPYAGAPPPPLGQGAQGPRSQAEEGWGIRGVQGMQVLKCKVCGGNLLPVSGSVSGNGEGLLQCPDCQRVYGGLGFEEGHLLQERL